MDSALFLEALGEAITTHTSLELTLLAAGDLVVDNGSATDRTFRGAVADLLVLILHPLRQGIEAELLIVLLVGRLTSRQGRLTCLAAPLAVRDLYEELVANWRGEGAAFLLRT